MIERGGQIIQPEKAQKIEKFKPEARKELENMNYRIYSLTGKSIRSLSQLYYPRV